MRRSHLRVVVVVLLISSLLAAGCTHTVEHRIARLSPTKPPGPTTRPAPETALYKVKYRTKSEDEFHSIPGTATVLSRGETIGFHVSEEGQIIAVAGRRTFPIEPPRNWRRLVWHTSFEEPTQFAIEMDEALRGTADVAAKAGLVVVGGVAVGYGFAQGLKGEKKKRRDD